LGDWKGNLDCKKLAVALLRFDWRFARLVAAVVIANKVWKYQNVSIPVRNGDILVSANPGCPVK